jgi:ABC-2 type transport system permease protein
VNWSTSFRSLLRKELLDLSRNRAALLPVTLVTLIALVLPFVIALVIPALTGERLSGDSDLVRVSGAADPPGELAPDARVQLFLLQQFLLLFLLTPITGAMALAAHSVVGEKQARTLEPLLATPISTFDLLMAKVLGALLPTLAIAVAGLLLYFAAIAALAEPGVLTAMADARTAVLILVIGPAAALLSLQAAILVSSRVNDARTAQQFGVFIVIPLTALLVAQFSGTLWLTAPVLALIGASLFVVWLLLAAITVRVFDRETILTRWR